MAYTPTPKGLIMGWAEKQPIPEGWALCDGENGTPDLRNKILLGAANLEEIGNESAGSSVMINRAPGGLPPILPAIVKIAWIMSLGS